MFVRKVSVRLKEHSLKQFTNLMKSEILPWLRMQEGFRDLILLRVTDSTEIAALSFWDHKSNAEAYDSCGYPRMLKILEDLLDGTPYVKTFEVVSSTCRWDATASPLKEENMIREIGLAQCGYPSCDTDA